MSGHEPTPPPPKWFSLIEEMKFDISSIEKMMKQLESLHSNHLLVGFGDDDGTEMKIQTITAEITKKIQENNRKLKLLGTKQIGESRDETLKKNIRSTIANQLQQLSTDFRRKQREYLEKMKGRMENDSDLFPVEHTEKPSVPVEEMYDQGFTQEQIEVVSTAHLRHQDRSREIQNIVRSIKELADIMEDLRVLVVDQGTILDRIDFNIEQVESMTNDAVSIVVEANETQQKSRTKICMMALCVAVMVLCLLLIAKFLWRRL